MTLQGRKSKQRGESYEIRNVVIWMIDSCFQEFEPALKLASEYLHCVAAVK